MESTSDSDGTESTSGTDDTTSSTDSEGTASDADTAITTSSIPINENTTSVHAFSSELSTVRSIKDLNDSSLFTINPVSGELFFISEPDFENPKDLIITTTT